MGVGVALTVWACVSFPQVLRVAEMLWCRGAQAPHGLVGAPREEGPEIPSKCHQQSEVQLLHLFAWGMYGQGQHRFLLPTPDVCSGTSLSRLKFLWQIL